MQQENQGITEEQARAFIKRYEGDLEGISGNLPPSKKLPSSSRGRKRDSLESQLPYFVKNSGVNIPANSDYPNPMDPTVQDYNEENK